MLVADLLDGNDSSSAAQSNSDDRVDDPARERTNRDDHSSATVPRREPSVEFREQCWPPHRRPSLNGSLASIVRPSRYSRSGGVRGARRAFRGRTDIRFFEKLRNRMDIFRTAADTEDSNECEVDTSLSTLSASMLSNGSDRSWVPAACVEFSTSVEVWYYDA